ncbi:ABC transporter permease subunit [Dactylosporangium sucinum]|uniref:ABC transporter permease n=1 Tax=Dactylosporangium sucinum TaxID=1424081 RepID=A0A917U7B4_9ACTN|nr:ABC transporter permease subunit [Dactylosporangium sucinum]GGM63515.1 ABC transporter permease [Dactylosporangium sucinum]
MLFLGPALVVLATVVAYPIVATVWYSFFNADGTRFVGLSNYVEMFTGPATRRAIINNVVWVVAAPTTVTALGLLFAVLSERIRLATAFKTVLFMPMAISFLAAGVTFTMVYEADKDRGALNAAIVSVHDVFKPPSKYYGTSPREEAGLVTVDGAVQTAQPAAATAPVMLPMVGLPPDRVPPEAVAAAPGVPGTGLRGVVWLDFSPGGGGRPGTVDANEKGLPGVVVEAVRDGTVVATTRTDPAGSFAFAQLTGDGYTIRLAASNFAPPFNGVTWLAGGVVTPAIIAAYIWIWAGFAMVLISAGLSAIPRDALEAARVDGATEWQVFRRVTIPLVRPVLVVVLVTLVINVLKIFDLVYILAPDPVTQDRANVVALQMYQTAFARQNTGLGSALAVLLFALVLPAMLYNVRRLRGDRDR